MTLPNLLQWSAQSSPLDPPFPRHRLRQQQALDLLDALAGAAEECEEMIRDEMRKEFDGVEWAVQVGFHAVQSMR